MGLDPRYVIAPSLQEFFIDKDSALPMSGGQAFFYEDDARTIPKPVYEISGTPPNYSYTVLPNPVTFSAVGTFQDVSGADIIPYYFPYDANGNVDLYYIEVYNSDGVLQFTREGWPNTNSANTPVNEDITNFVPNGQFLLHNNIPATSTNGFVPGQISQAVTVIGQGGWTFERNNGTSATDIVTFPEYPSVTSPSGNPRYACQINTTVANPSDTRKDLCLKFAGVNTFASPINSFNLYFEALALTGSNVTVQIIIRKFFGTGGSPSATTETVVTTQTIPSSSVKFFNTALFFGSNTSTTLGTNNDDYVQVIVRLPPTGTQNVIFTDFCITSGSTTLTSFPTQTEAQQLDQSTAGWLPTPDPNGYNLYLPIILTQKGFDFDQSAIGQIVGKTEVTPVANELLMDGSVYITSAYSSLGIPYRRLFNYLVANCPTATNIVAGTTPMFGTGAQFATIYTVTGQPTHFNLVINTAGGSAAVSNGTSGFTHTGSQPNFVFTVVGVPTAGQYFTFTSNDNHTYNVWYSVNGLGTAPAGTSIEVKLVTGDTTTTTASKTLAAVNGYQFAVLDARGYFWRGLDTNAVIDPDAASRTIPQLAPNNSALTGANLGSLEAGAFLSHNHAPGTGNTGAEAMATFAGQCSVGGTGAFNFSAGNNNDGFNTTANTGGTETRPINLALNWFIKY